MNDLDFYCKNNVSREKLLETEKEIVALIGLDPENLNLRNLSQMELKKLEEFFSRRCWILNNLFTDTPQNLFNLKRVNDHLRNLYYKLRERVNVMKDKVEFICDDPSFDDDYEIEGTIKFSYNGPESVLKFEDDDIYGSNFRLMISALYEFYYDKMGYEGAIIEIYPGNENMDERISWNEPPLNYEELEVSYLSHCFCNHLNYSVPDFIRLNDFWTEVKFIEQSITEQNGNRWNVLQKKN